MDEPVTLSTFPSPLYWHVRPARWNAAPSSLTITAQARTDLFTDPQGSTPMVNAPRLHGPVAGDFQLSALVEVDFGAMFDAGVILVWDDDAHWAKLCFEYSPRRQPMVVSVVTRGVSDDANGFVVDGTRVWLRASRRGQAWAFHASLDGRRWELIRHFSLGGGAATNVGFLAQSPTGPGCTVTFGEIHFVPERLRELRNGE